MTCHPKSSRYSSPLASCLNWVDRAGGVRAGETVVIQAPSHGLISAAVSRAAGAGQIIVTGTGATACDFATAKAVGADHTIDVDSEDPWVPAVAGLTGVAADWSSTSADSATVTVAARHRNGGDERPGVLAGLKQMAPAQIISDLNRVQPSPSPGGPGSTPQSMREAGPAAAREATAHRHAARRCPDTR